MKRQANEKYLIDKKLTCFFCPILVMQTLTLYISFLLWDVEKKNLAGKIQLSVDETGPHKHTR